MREIFASVRVFDGDRVLDGPRDVVPEDGVIAAVAPAGCCPASSTPTCTCGGQADVRELARWG